jgi:hypothetical protein
LEDGETRDHLWVMVRRVVVSRVQRHSR